MADAAPLRIGILGAARIAPMALIRPARAVTEAVVAAVAARDSARARKFAAKHAIARVHESYEALIEDPDLDAIYNPLPNGLHCDWTIRALEAGKHVLCEKPLASNTVEAERMAEAAARTGRKLVEAFHWRYHALAARMREIVRGELGSLNHVEGHMCLLLPMRGDIRYRFDLAGGGLMDAGCYAVSLVRWLAEAEPEVVAAEARLASPKVDRWIGADLRFPDGRTGRITCALFSSSLFRFAASARGTEGEMRVLNPVAPQFYHRLRVRSGGATRRERVRGEPTYTAQLRAFVRHVREGTPVPTGPDDAVANMRVIDAIYTKAGLPLRGT